MKLLFVGINAKFSHTALSIYYLKQIVEKIKNITAGIKEYTINSPYEQILSEIALEDCDILLFSAYIWNIEIIKRLLADIKKIKPTLKIIVGGPEVSFGEKLENSDFIIEGEGEGKLFSLISSLVGEKITKNEGYVNLDTLPFAYENLDALKNRAIYYESSRGCSFGCAYCLSSADKNMRFKSLDIVFCDLKRFIEKRVMRVKFVDRTFNINSERATKIWQYLIENDNGYTTYHFEIGGDLLTMEQIKLLKKVRAGLFQFEIGVQSTNAKTLSSIARKMDIQRLCSNVSELLSTKNIHLHLDLIAGLPHEDYSSFLASFDTVMTLLPHKLQLGFLKLLKGSSLYNIREKYGIVASDTPPYTVLCTNDISFAELTRLKELEEIVDSFYNTKRFNNTLLFLQSLNKTPHELYLSLAEHKKEANKANESLSKYDAYDFLYSFYKSQNGQNEKELLEKLKLDLLLHEPPKKLPLCLLGKLNTAKRLQNNRYAEHFEGKTLLFDYSKRDINGHAETTII